MDRLLDLSDQLAAAVQRAGQSVLAVHGRPRMPSTGIHWRAGLIVTANHTLQADEDLTVTSPTGESSRVTVVGRDPGLDVAILRIDSPATAVADVGDSDAVRVGHMVLALGAGPRASWGVISAIGAASSRARERCLQPGPAPLSRVLGRAARRRARRGRRRQHVGRIAAPAPGHSGERGESRRRRRGPPRPGPPGLPGREHAADPGAGGRARRRGGRSRSGGHRGRGPARESGGGRAPRRRRHPGARRRGHHRPARSSRRAAPRADRSAASRRRCSGRAACSR